ncbi:TonB-dependent receptor [Pararhodonellum marinum]|uniref:TonB-dependent receptor n=1 Tax=Pararhodonellum marinum TaxID=2755358 RepID=UPI00188F11E5|nr:TonB-dependent receptor [Pararhodonellum marinum]
MKKIIFSLSLVLFFQATFAQRVTINGTVKDRENGETLIGVNIFDKVSQKGSVTNNYGFFSYTTQSGEVDLVFSFVGYQSFVFKTFLEKDTTLTVELSSDFQLEEFVLEESRGENIMESTQMGSINVPLRQIKDLPALLGEVDVFKILQLLPGVQSGSEGGSGLYVRGGGPDQNLVLLDGVPVYNATHLFGFFSVFNADAINNVELIKGGFPARYGGRLSSVIDINMKEGNMKKFEGEGSVGLIASKFTLEGPIVKDKTSFLVSGRRTYLDLITRPIIRNQSGGNDDVGYFFYDLNAKVNHIFDKNNRLYLSYYGGNDIAYSRFLYQGTRNGEPYNSNEKAGLGWGNQIGAIRWNHVFNKKLFANFTGTYTRYNFNLFAEFLDTWAESGVPKEEFFTGRYDSGIRDYAYKADFDFIPNTDHYIRFGGMHIFHRFTPGVYVSRETGLGETKLGTDPENSQEYAFYVEDDVNVTERIKVNAGLHFSGFLTGSKHYTSLQPRISARYLLDEKSSVKASYVQMAQFIHLLTNAGLGLPTDLWVPSTETIAPQESWQASMGYFRGIGMGLEFSVEAYYKGMQGLIEYQDGASYLNIEENWQNKVVSGEGRSYGVELLLQKKLGKTTGWVGYTWSKTERRFDEVNFGEWFPFRYDRRHDVSITAVHKISDKIDLSGVWVFGSGNFISVPTQAYNHYDAVSDEFYRRYMYLEHYESRNNFQMRSYHRLDVGINFNKKKSWGERTWNVSVYNVYNRQNPFYMDIAYNYAQQRNMLAQYSLFPVIPSVSYRFKF